MTKAPTPAEMSKGQSDNSKKRHKKVDYTVVADRLRKIKLSWKYIAVKSVFQNACCFQTSVLLPKSSITKQVYSNSTFKVFHMIRHFATARIQNFFTLHVAI